MGQLVIEVPQNINRSYQVDDSDFSERLLNDLEGFQKKHEFSKNSAVIPPRRNSLKEDGDAVLGIWADNEEEADEIARRVREANRRTT